jgi:hypothetical protein
VDLEHHLTRRRRAQLEVFDTAADLLVVLVHAQRPE